MTAPHLRFAEYRAQKEVAKKLDQLHRWIGNDVPREQLDVLVALLEKLLPECGIPTLETAAWKAEIADLKRHVSTRPNIRKVK